MKVRLRPIEEKDALISYKWRNDNRIWKYTGSKPDKFITPEIESEWLKKVLKKNNELRYAICIGDDCRYIGNIQLTNIISNGAQFHIFIGEHSCHGKGIGTKATKMLINIAFNVLNLKEIYLYVKKDNLSAINIYEKCNFKRINEKGNQIKMILQNVK